MMEIHDLLRFMIQKTIKNECHMENLVEEKHMEDKRFLTKLTFSFNNPYFKRNARLESDHSSRANKQSRILKKKTMSL